MLINRVFFSFQLNVKEKKAHDLSISIHFTLALFKCTLKVKQKKKTNLVAHWPNSRPSRS